MANIDERVVALKINDGQFQQAAARVAKTLEQLKVGFQFKDTTKGMENISKSASKVDNDVAKMSEHATKNIKDIDNAADKVDLSNISTSAQKMGNQVANSAGTAAESIQNIDEAANRTDLSGVSNAAAKMSSQVENYSSVAAESIQDIDAAGDKVDLQGVTSASSSMANQVVESSGQAAKGIRGIQTAVDSINMDAIAKQMDSVTAKIEPMQAALAGMFAGLGQKAIGYGMTTMQNFTQGLKDGFAEYETQINSVQTILANTQSKGTTIGDVNKALAELNTYADQTIYNFSEMTRNIGTFTAAGVDLGTSVSAIKGIANLAAVSGSNSQQASTAMYQLSQALSTGTVKLMDWNSVVNAGMGGQVFQDALIRTSERLGTGAKNYIAAQGSFRDSLQKEWLTADVLNETLKQMAGAYSEAELMQQGYTEAQAKEITQLAHTATNAATKVKTFTQLMDTYKEAVGSGWTRIWQLMFGDFEEAQEGFSRLSDQLGKMVTESSNAREAVVKQWADLGGRKELFGFFSDAITMVQSWVKPIKEGFAEVFSGTGLGKTLYNFTKGLHDLVKALTLTGNGATALKNVAKALATVLKIVLEVVKLVARAFGLLFGVIGKIFGVISTLVVKLGDLINYFKGLFDASKIVERATNAWKSSLDGITLVLKTVGEAFTGFFQGVKQGFFGGGSGGGQSLINIPNILDNIGNGFKSFGDRVNQSGKNFRKAFEESFGSAAEIAKNVSEKIRNAIEAVKPVFHWISDKLSEAGQVMKGFFGDLSGQVTLKNFLDMLNSGVLLMVLTNLKKITDAFKDFTGLFKMGKQIQKGIDDVLKGVGKSFGSFESEFSVGKIAAIAGAIFALSHALSELAALDASELAVGIGGLTTAFGSLVGTMAALGALSNMKRSKKGGNGNAIEEAVFDFQGIKQLVPGIIAISGSMLLLAKAASMLKGMDPVEIATIFGSMSAAIVAIGGSIALMGSIDPKAMEAIGQNLTAVGKNFALIGVGLLLISLAVVKIGSLNPDQLAKGLGGVAGALIAVTGALAVLAYMQNTKAGKNGGFMTRGSYDQVAGSLIAVAAAINMLMVPILAFGRMSLTSLAKGLGTVAIGLGLMSGALAGLAYMQGTKMGGSFTSVAASIMAMAAAINLMMVPIAIMGHMDMLTLAKGLGGVAIALGAMVFAMEHLSQVSKDGASNLAVTAGAVVAFAGAIAIMAIPIKMIGTMDLGDLVKGLIGLGGAMAAIVFASKEMGNVSNLKEVAVGIVAFAGAMMVMAVAFRMMGAISTEGLIKSLVGFSAVLIGLFYALKVLMPMMASSIPTWMAFTKGMALFGVGVLAFGAGLVALSVGVTTLSSCITVVMELIKVMLISFINFIPDLLASLVSALTGALKVLVAGLPELLAQLGEALSIVYEFLIEQVPKLAEALITLVDEVLKRLADHAPSITDSLVRILVASLNAISGHAPEITKAVGNVINAIFDAIIESANNSGPEKMMGMIASFGIMALMFKQLAKMKKDVVGALAVAGSILLIMAGLAAIFAAMSALNVQNVIPNALGLVIALEGFVDAFDMMDRLNAKDVGKYIALGSSMALVMAELAAVFVIMSKMGVDNVLPNAAGLSMALVAIGGVFEVFSHIPIPAALSAGGSLATAIGVVAGIFAALGAINQIPGFGWLVGKGIDILCKLGEGIGRFIGSFVKGLIGEALSVLPEIASQLSAFMKQMDPFFEQANKLNPDSLQGVDTLVNIIMKLTANGVLNKFAQIPFEDSPIEKIEKDLPKLGGAIVAFADQVKDLDNGAVESAAKSMRILIDLQNGLPAMGGVVGFFAGEKNWDNLSTGLVSLGRTLKKFGEEVKGLDTEAIKTSVPAMKALVGVQESLPAVGGLWQAITGSKNWSGLSDGMVNLGRAIKGYSEEVAGMDTKAVEASVPALQKLVDVQNSLEKSGGVKGFLFGEKSLGNFGDNLKELGTGVASFAEAASGDDVDLSKVDSMVKSVKALVKMESDLPDRSFGAKLFGDQDLSKFGDQVKKLGEGISEFGKAVNTEDVNTIKISTIIKSVDDLMGLSKKLNSFDSNGLEKISNALKAAKDLNLAAFSKAIGTNHTTATKKLKELGDGLKQSGPSLKEGFNSVRDAFKGIDDKIINKASKMSEAITKLNGLAPDLLGTGGWFGKDAVNYEKFGNQLENIGGAIKKFGDSAADIDTGNIKKGVDAINSVATLSIGNMPDFDGLEKAMSNLSKGIKAYASDDLMGLDFGTMVASIAPAERLIKMITGLEVGNNGIPDLSGFEAACAELKRGLYNYWLSVQGMDMANVTASIGPLEKLLKFVKDYSGTEFDGISGFEAACAELKRGLWNYWLGAKGITTEDIAGTFEPVKKLLEFSKSYAGTKFDSITGFEAACAELKRGLWNYWMGAKGIKSDDISSSFEGVEQLLLLVSKYDDTEFGSVTGFEAACAEFQKGLHTYWDKAKGIKKEDLVSSFTPLEKLIGLANTYSNTNFGNLEGFEEVCAELKAGLYNYWIQVQSMEMANVVASTEPVGQMLDFAKKYGGKKFGALEGFGACMKSLSDGLIDFSKFTTVEGIDATNLKNMKDAANGIVQMANGWRGYEFNPMTNFKTCCESVATGVGSYAESINSINDTQKFTGTFETVKNLVNFTKELPKEVSIPENFSGVLTDLGFALYNFYLRIDDVKAEAFSGGIQCLRDLHTALQAFNDADTINTNISKLQNAINSAGDFGIDNLIFMIGDNAKTLEGKLDGIVKAVNDGAQDVANAFTAMNAKFQELNVSDTAAAQLGALVGQIDAKNGDISRKFANIGDTISNFGTTITNNFANPKSKMSEQLKALVTVVKDYNDDFKSAGTKLISELISGMESKLNELNNKNWGAILDTGLSTVLNSIKSYRGNFHQVGVYVAEGFANGITDGTNSAVNAASRMAAAAINAAKKEAGVHSPSRVFYQIGDYVVQGFVNGIDDNAKMATRSSELMAAKTVSAFNRVIRNIDTNAIDMTPRITPVMDLSNVYAGSANISNLLGDQSFSAKLVGIQPYASPLSMMSAQQSAMEEYQASVMASNNTLQGSIDGMREDLNAYTTAVESQETAMYVDGKKLATTIAKPMNQQLGTLSRRQRLG